MVEKLGGEVDIFKILHDERDIKPGVLYQTLFSFDDSALDKPGFVAMSIPFFSLKSELLFEQVQLLINIAHKSNGFTFMVINDNLNCNQIMFSLFHGKF